MILAAESTSTREAYHDPLGAFTSILRGFGSATGPIRRLLKVLPLRAKPGDFCLTRDYPGNITKVVMNRPVPHRIGDLQLKILQILWLKPDASVGEVHAALQSDRPLAYTTIATMLRKMEARGLVSHAESGRAFLYRARLKPDELNRSVGRHFVKRFFEGSLAQAVSHLLQTHEVSRAELDHLARLIQEAKRRKKS